MTLAASRDIFGISIPPFSLLWLNYNSIKLNCQH
nr:MAG TPA: hypothetical protein [Caudoviricetes sp.]